MNCRMCFVKSPTPLNKKELSIEQWKQIIGFAIKFDNEFDIAGGEPLLKCGIRELLSFISESGGTFTLTSNGTLIEKISFILQDIIKNFSGNKIEVSVDSINKQEYNFLRGAESFKYCMKGLDKLADLKKNIVSTNVIGIAQVMTKINSESFPTLVEFADSKGFDYVYSQSLDPINNGRRMLSLIPSPQEYGMVIIKTLEKLVNLKNPTIKRVSIYCPQPYFHILHYFFHKNLLIIHKKDSDILFEIDTKNCNCKMFTEIRSIDPYGNLSGCFAMANVKEAFVGNMLDIQKYSKEDFEKLLRDSRKRFYAKVIENLITCKYCKNFQSCGGGCRAAALANNSISGPDPRCNSFIRQMSINDPVSLKIITNFNNILNTHEITLKSSEN